MGISMPSGGSFSTGTSFFGTLLEKLPHLEVMTIFLLYYCKALSYQHD